MEKKNKHAYLILAHNNFEILKILVKLLDDERNDIYIHVDKKSVNFNENDIKKSIKYSEVFFIERMNVTWGGYSLIQCEINLLKEASTNNYQYYHFLSGVDLPLKNQDCIHEFFDKHYGKLFVHFCPKEYNENVKFRYSIYHPFQDIVGRDRGILSYVEKLLVYIQKKVKFIDRTMENIEYVGGSNWCSLTNEFVKYILKNEKLIKKLFKYTTCCDELYIQTLVKNSKFYNAVYEKEDSYLACMRYIDWKRGNPYVFDINDWEELYNSEFVFARKFSLDTEDQRALVRKVCEIVLS